MDRLKVSYDDVNGGFSFSGATAMSLQAPQSAVAVDYSVPAAGTTNTLNLTLKTGSSPVISTPIALTGITSATTTSKLVEKIQDASGYSTAGYTVENVNGQLRFARDDGAEFDVEIDGAASFTGSLEGSSGNVIGGSATEVASGESVALTFTAPSSGTTNALTFTLVKGGATTTLVADGLSSTSTVAHIVNAIGADATTAGYTVTVVDGKLTFGTTAAAAFTLAVADTSSFAGALTKDAASVIGGTVTAGEETVVGNTVLGLTQAASAVGENGLYTPVGADLYGQVRPNGEFIRPLAEQRYGLKVTFD